MLVQVSIVKGDVADEQVIETLCRRAIEDYRRLDVFFANVMSYPQLTFKGPSHSFLGSGHSGWLTGVLRRHDCGNLYERVENQRSFVWSSYLSRRLLTGSL